MESVLPRLGMRACCRYRGERTPMAARGSTSRTAGELRRISENTAIGVSPARPEVVQVPVAVWRADRDRQKRVVRVEAGTEFGSQGEGGIATKKWA